MKVLLIDPKRLNLESYIIIPNIGLGYVSTALRRAGHEPVVCSASRDGLVPRQVADRAAAGCYDVAGITVMTPFLSSSAAYASAIKNECPGITIVAGGAHAIFEGEELLRLIPEIDFAVTGEGEETFPALLSALRGDSSREERLAEIPNLCFRSGDGFVSTPRRIIPDVRPLDPPAWDLLEPDRFGLYPNGIFTMGGRTAPVVTSRGCPCKCSFCGAGRAMGATIRHRKISVVIDEIAMLHEKYGFVDIHFLDDNVAADRAYALEMFDALARKNLPVVWGCPPGVRLDSVDEEIAAAMKRSGCYSTSMGIESGSPRVLRLMRKGIDLSQAAEKLAILKKNGIRVSGLFVLGYPGETVEEMKQSVAFALRLNFDKANFFLFTPFPGSECYDRLKQEGKLAGFNYDDAYIHHVGYCGDTIPRDALIRIHRGAYLRFYLRPRVLLGIVREIHSLSQVRVIIRRARRIIFPRARVLKG